MLNYLVCNFMLRLGYRLDDGRGIHRGWCTLKPTLKNPSPLTKMQCECDEVQTRVQFQGFKWCINNYLLVCFQSFYRDCVSAIFDK